MVMILFDEIPLIDYITNLWDVDVEFEAENPNYRCARRTLHVLIASKVFVMIDFAVMVVYFWALFPFWLLWILPHIALLLVTLYALKKEKARWLWPFVIYTAGQFLLWSIFTFFFFIISFFSKQTFLEFFNQGHQQDTVTRVVLVILFLLFILAFAVILFWRFAIFWTTKKYLEDKADGNVELQDPNEAQGLAKLLTPI